MPRAAFVTGERTALNFLQTLSGTATATRIVRRSRRGHCDAPARHAQDAAGPAPRAEIRRALRRRRESPHRPVRRGPDQGEPHRGRRRPARRRQRGAAPLAARPDSRSRSRAWPSSREALETEADRIMLDDFSLDDMRARGAAPRRPRRQAQGARSVRQRKRAKPCAASPRPASTSSRSAPSPSTCARSTSRCASSRPRCALLRFPAALGRQRARRAAKRGYATDWRRRFGSETP